MAVTSYLTREFMKLSSIYPNFEEDLLREVTLQKVALRTIRLRVNHQLTQEEFAAKLDIKRAYLARLEAGHHNPTIMTLVELALLNGYEIEIKLKEKTF